MRSQDKHSINKKVVVLLLTLVVLVVCVIMAIQIDRVKKQEVYSKMNRVEQFLHDEDFMYGIVVPWLDGTYGCDIGYSEVRDDTTIKFNEKAVREVFTNCKVMGFNVIRIWLFEIMEGIKFDEQGKVIEIQKEFIDNLKTMCNIAKEIDMPLIVTLQPHISYSMNEEDYKFYTQILFEEEYRNTYFENALRPLMKELVKFDNIIMIDIYAEPEGDVSGGTGNCQLYGGTWEQITDYITQSALIIKEYTTDIPVTACSGWRKYASLKEGRYNQMELDYIGVDIYDDSGFMEPVDTLNTNRPVWLAEFGPETKDNWSDKFFADNTIAFFNEAKTKGYIGAFLWMYGSKNSGEALSVIRQDGAKRTTFDEIKQAIAELQGSDIDKYPAIYFPSIDRFGKVDFIGISGAVEYVLQECEDGKWVEKDRIKVEDIKGEEPYFEYVYYPNETRSLRVIAIDESGKQYISDTL